MNATKQKKLQQAGWKVGSSTDFLELSEAEETIVEMKLALATKLREMRKKQKLTQAMLAKHIGSSQSRVAKMEIADRSVSIELLIRTVVTLGASRSEIGNLIGARRKTRAAKKRLIAK